MLAKRRFPIFQFAFYGLVLVFCLAAAGVGAGSPSDAEKILDGVSKAADVTSVITAPAAPFNPLFIVISSVAAAIGSIAAALRTHLQNRRLERERRNLEKKP